MTSFFLLLKKWVFFPFFQFIIMEMGSYCMSLFYICTHTHTHSMQVIKYRISDIYDDYFRSVCVCVWLWFIVKWFPIKKRIITHTLTTTNTFPGCNFFSCPDEIRKNSVFFELTKFFYFNSFDLKLTKKFYNLYSISNYLLLFTKW